MRGAILRSIILAPPRPGAVGWRVCPSGRGRRGRKRLAHCHRPLVHILFPLRIHQWQCQSFHTDLLRLRQRAAVPHHSVPPPPAGPERRGRVLLGPFRKWHHHRNPAFQRTGRGSRGCSSVGLQFQHGINQPVCKLYWCHS